MPKRRISSAAQKSASIRNLAKARAARRLKASQVPVGKPRDLPKGSMPAIGVLKTKIIWVHPKTGEKYHATRSFRGTTTVGKKVQ